MKKSDSVRFGGMVTSHPLISTWPFSSLKIYDDRIELVMFLWRKRVISKDSVWSIILDKVVIPPLLWRSYFEFRWSESGSPKKVLFVRTRTKALAEELKRQGWPLIVQS